MRIGTLLLAAALACSACSQAPGAGGQQPGGPGGAPSGAGSTPTAQAGDIRFKITFIFDTRAVEPDTWVQGEFTTTGTLSRAIIDAMTSTRGYVGADWPSSGTQSFGDWHCATPDECLDPCVGGYNSQWQDEPTIGRLEQSGGHVVLDAQLHPRISAQDDRFLTTPNCPGAVNMAVGGFPPMHITIDGLDGSSPAYSIEPYEFDGTEAPAPGVIWTLTITPIP